MYDNEDSTNSADNMLEIELENSILNADDIFASCASDDDSTLGAEPHDNNDVIIDINDNAEPAQNQNNLANNQGNQEEEEDNFMWYWYGSTMSLLMLSIFWLIIFSGEE